MIRSGKDSIRKRRKMSAARRRLAEKPEAMDINVELQRAVNYHQKGRISEARELYDRILAVAPMETYPSSKLTLALASSHWAST